jgi:hypothetical protein
MKIIFPFVNHPLLKKPAAQPNFPMQHKYITAIAFELKGILGIMVRSFQK